MDTEKIQRQLGELQQKLTSLVPVLHSVDEKRIIFIEKFLRNDLTLDLAEENNFVRLTESSISLLEQFETLFLQILGHVLLLEKQSHHGQQFKALHTSYFLIEKRLRLVVQLRKREIQCVSYLRRQRQSSTLLRLLRNLAPMKLILKRTISSEILSLLMIVTLAFRSGEELRHLQEAMKTEDKKEVVRLTVIGALFLAPGAGVVLCLLSNALLEWLNTFTPNFKRLMKLIER